MEKGKIAQRKFIVLLKNEMKQDSSLPLPLSGKPKIYIENIGGQVASNYGTGVDSLADADYAVLRLQTPWESRDGNFIEAMFHQGKLNFEEPELSRILEMAEKKPNNICAYMIARSFHRLRQDALHYWQILERTMMRRWVLFLQSTIQRPYCHLRCHLP
jgi:hypothetical protein